MKKKTFCLAMAAVMALGLTGCGGAETKGEAAPTVESTADTTAADTTAAARLPRRPRLRADILS